MIPYGLRHWNCSPSTLYAEALIPCCFSNSSAFSMATLFLGYGQQLQIRHDGIRHNLRIIPQSNMGTCFSHSLRNRMTKSIGSASDGNHLPLHLKLLHNIWWRVRERPGEAWPDSRTIFEGHRHLSVVILVLWKCSERGSHIWGLLLFIMSPTWNRRNLTDPLSVQCWPRCVVWSHIRALWYYTFRFVFNSEPLVFCHGLLNYEVQHMQK